MNKKSETYNLNNYDYQRSLTMTSKEAIEFLKAREISWSKWSYNEQVALKMCIEALEKQIPKKLIDRKEDEVFGTVYTCRCNSKVIDIMKYCPECGQRLNWSNI